MIVYFIFYDVVCQNYRPMFYEGVQKIEVACFFIETVYICVTYSVVTRFSCCRGCTLAAVGTRHVEAASFSSASRLYSTWPRTTWTPWTPPVRVPRAAVRMMTVTDPCYVCHSLA